MKKILYVIAALMLMCGSCNDTIKISSNNQSKYRVSDTIDIDTCTNDTFLITQKRVNAKGISDYIYYCDTVVLLRDTFWTFIHYNQTTFYIPQYSLNEIRKFKLL